MQRPLSGRHIMLLRNRIASGKPHVAMLDKVAAALLDEVVEARRVIDALVHWHNLPTTPTGIVVRGLPHDKPYEEAVDDARQYGKEVWGDAMRFCAVRAGAQAQGPVKQSVKRARGGRKG